MILFLGCGEKIVPKPVESWQDSPDHTTTRIKVKSEMPTEDLKLKIIDRLIWARFVVDTSGNLKTKMKRVENYYVRLNVSFQNNSAIFEGEYGSLGLNRPLDGSEPGEHYYNWEKIVYSGRGWEILNGVSYLRNTTKEYNKFVYEK